MYTNTLKLALFLSNASKSVSTYFISKHHSIAGTIRPHQLRPINLKTNALTIIVVNIKATRIVANANT